MRYNFIDLKQLKYQTINFFLTSDKQEVYAESTEHTFSVNAILQVLGQ